ncbi:DNA methyltransferase 1-associated protein 1 [Ischnura elegans]|uniref:DNA methyltransferase 1-associated protein 1 n=1 Tax=Ischnura elegans TaxID=197161 RepID=UPI001ED8BDF7|nr:DNA methyltransferase 1-associated protein 1 [Ischnura elegans]
MADVRDILELERPPTPELTKEAIIGVSDKKKIKPKKAHEPMKRPEGMHRELFALLYTDNMDAAPIFPTDTGKGYKQMKAKLGMRRVRPWKWMPFTNPARKDGAVFHHWRRLADEGKEYPFAQFNKQVPVPSYTDSEYRSTLATGLPGVTAGGQDGWSREETDHLMDLCRRFDLRFPIIHDRWDRSHFPERSVEDLKERYYEICSLLAVMRGQETKTYVFDADHERRRKEQLRRLFERTPDQIEEEQTLLNELRKIEARKKEREKKTQDLQKLITAADSQVESRKAERKVNKKKLLHHPLRPRPDAMAVETAGIKFPDFKGTGVSLRSQRMKLPASVGQKKTKAIEHLLHELNIELNPMPTEEISVHFNELRSDMVLLYELKTALATCEFELQTLRHQYEALNPGKTLAIPMSVSSSAEKSLALSSPAVPGLQPPQLTPQTLEAQKPPKPMSEIIDVVGSPGTPPGVSGT